MHPKRAAPKQEKKVKAQKRVKKMQKAVRPMATAASLDKTKPIGFMGRFLEGKNALVTGSTSGIGLGVAKVLAAHGANLTLNGFGDANEIKKIQQDIAAQHNVKVRYSPADMTKPDQIKKMIEDAQKEYGTLDILVNNAGIQHISSVEEFPEEQWDKVIAINLSAAFHASKAAIPQMKQNGYGRILNVASVHGVVASVNKSAYVASKHGIVGFTKAAALELAGTGVTVNAINPGWVLTPLVEKQIDLRAEKMGTTWEEARISLLSEKQPSKEFVTVDDLGNLAAWLCSPYAGQITGQSNILDGAWTIQ
eukprot:UN04315